MSLIRGNKTFAILLLITIACGGFTQVTPISRFIQVALTANAQTPAPSKVTSKSWQNARLVKTLSLTNSQLPVLSPDSQILATYRRGEKISDDGKIIAQTNENIINLTSIKTSEKITTLSYNSPSEIKSLVFSPNGKNIASGNYYRDILSIKLWDVATGREIQTLRRIVKPKRIRTPGTDPSANSQIAFSPDGNYLISFSGGNPTIQVWDVAATISKQLDNQLIQSFPTNKDNSKSQSTTNPIQQSVEKDRQRYPDYEVLDYDIARDALDAGKDFAAIKQQLNQQSKMVQHWRKTESKSVYQRKKNYYIDLVMRLQSISYVHNKALAVLDEFGKETSEGQRKFTKEGYVIESNDNNFIIADNNGKRIIMQIKDGKYDLNNYPSFQDVTQVKAFANKLLNQGALKFNLTGHADEIKAFAFSPDGQILVSASADKTMKVWNLRTGKLIHTIKVNNIDSISEMVISYNQVLAMAGTEENTIKLWDLKAKKLIRKLPLKGLASTIGFSSDGNQLINVSSQPFMNMRVEVWNLKTGKLIRHSSEIGTPRNIPVGIDISPDNKTYAVTGEYLPLQVRDLITDKIIINFNSKEDFVFYSADGKTLITSGTKGIKIWQ